MSMSRRSFGDFRYLCSELIEVERVDPASSERKKTTGNLEEIGRRTAVFLAEESYFSGCRVRLACRSRYLEGVVEACQKVKLLGFLIEVRLDFHSQGWPHWFTPEHLLTLNGMALRNSSEKTAKVPEKSLQAIRTFCTKNCIISAIRRRREPSESDGRQSRPAQAS
jgi:hypothetical protein